MKSTNPQKDFKTTPTQFSETSRIIGTESEDYRSGVILDSPEEFKQALIVYSNGSVRGSRATQNKLMEGLGDKGGGMGAPLLILGGSMNADGFTDRLTKEALSALNGSGRFNRSFDYDAMGTNFFKTTVDGKRVGDKYLLGLSAAYVGTEPERKLAETIQKPMGLARSSVKAKLSVVDDWWFNVNLEDALQNLPIPDEQLDSCISHMNSGYSDRLYMEDPPVIEFEHNGNKFALDIGLDADKYLRPENAERGSEYIGVRENNVIGGAWTIYNESGNDRVDPRVINPSIVLSVSQPGDRYSRLPAVTEKEITTLQEARDHLANFLVSE